MESSYFLQSATSFEESLNVLLLNCTKISVTPSVTWNYISRALRWFREMWNLYFMSSNNLFTLSWDINKLSSNDAAKSHIDSFYRWRYKSLSYNWQEGYKINLDCLDGNQRPKVRSSPEPSMLCVVSSDSTAPPILHPLSSPISSHTPLAQYWSAICVRSPAHDLQTPRKPPSQLLLHPVKSHSPVRSLFNRFLIKASPD